MSDRKYLIASYEHTHDDTIVWWKPDRMGYTIDIDKAGLYTLEEAKEICERANYGRRENDPNEKYFTFDQILDGDAGYLCRTVTKL